MRVVAMLYVAQSMVGNNLKCLPVNGPTADPQQPTAKEEGMTREEIKFYLKRMNADIGTRAYRFSSPNVTALKPK
jgi:hypothetical protein